MSEQLTRNYLIDVVNGRTIIKEQERQFVSTVGKQSVVKTGSQGLADSITEEGTHQYKRRHGCFWTLCHGQNGQREKARISSSRHGALKAVIHVSMLSGQNLHTLSISLRFPNWGKLRRENL